MEKKLATITILVKDRQAKSAELNKLLTDSGHLVASRLGVNVQKNCLEHCTGLMVVVLEANAEEINDLFSKIKGLNLRAELVIFSDEE